MIILSTDNTPSYDAEQIHDKIVSWFSRIGIVETEKDTKTGLSHYGFDRDLAADFFENYRKSNLSKTLDTHGAISLDKMNKLFRGWFEKDGYKLLDPINILHKNGGKETDPNNTIFTIAGVQALENILFDVKSDEVTGTEKFFISQPSIRMASLSNVGIKRGYFSSFINICSEVINPSMEDYITDIGLWLKLLTAYIDPESIKLKLRRKEVVWSGKPSSTFQIFFYCNGLEIGDSSFHYRFNKSEDTQVTFIDSGFGLERLALSIYKDASDIEIIGPTYFRNKKFESIDRTRTLTLLIGSNVMPDNTVAGLKVRHLFKDLVLSGDDYTWYELIPYFYEFWSKFTESTMIVNPAKARAIIRDEYNRQKNRYLAVKLGLNLSNQELSIPTYEFVENCISGVYGSPIPRERVASLI